MNEAINPQETAQTPNLDQSVVQNPPQTEQSSTQIVKKKSPVVAILSFLLVLALGAAGYFAYELYFVDNSNSNSESNQQSNSSPTPAPTAVPFSDWNEYVSEEHEIEFKYPSDWGLVEKIGQTEYEGMEPYNTSVELTKGDALINIMLNVNGIGGLPTTREGKSYTLDGYDLFMYEDDLPHTNRKMLGISNEAKTLGVFHLGYFTYNIQLSYPDDISTTAENELIEEFDNILSTFKFTSFRFSNEEKFENNYSNSRLGFSLKIPDYWSGKYYAELNGNTVVFMYQADGEENAMLFSVSRYSVSEYNNLDEMSKNMCAELTEVTNFVYCSTPSIEMTYRSFGNQDKYGAMTRDYQDIISSFEVI